MQDKQQQIREALTFRHACKKFDASRKIPQTDFELILDAAHLSPSSFGFEPWRFVVLQDTALRKKLLACTWGAQGQLPTASHYVVILARKAVDTKASSSYTSAHMQQVQKLPEDLRQQKADKYRAFQQNDFDLNDDRKLFDWACKQCYIALANMMTAAALLEIDSCAIEGFERDKVENILEQADVYDAEHYGVAVMVAFGYRQPDKPQRPKTRRLKKDVIEWIK